MDTNELEIVLCYQVSEFNRLNEQIDNDISVAEETQKNIDQLDSRVDAILTKIDVLDIREVPVELRVIENSPQESTATAWDDLKERAEANLISRGVIPAEISLDNLLDEEEVRKIEKRFYQGFSISSHLDKYDILAAISAGLVAGIIDFLIVKIPKDITYLGKHLQEGSPLTKWMRNLSIKDDNWLAKYFKVGYDQVKKTGIEGISPRTHRLQSLGHDPLIGLVIGTIDIMRGSMTAISRDGVIKVLENLAPGQYNPFIALVAQIGHLFSDIATKMGLPCPGWSMLQLFQVGDFGKNQRTIADLARFMYLKGFDFRHFLTMSTSVAAAEIILRSYFWLRQKWDNEYAEEMAYEKDFSKAQKTGDYPRFQSLALTAHLIGSAANAGKIAVYSGNPLAVNYAQWLRFLQAAYQWLKARWKSPTDLLIARSRANLLAIDRGWPDFSFDTSFPCLKTDTS